MFEQKKKQHKPHSEHNMLLSVVSIQAVIFSHYALRVKYIYLWAFLKHKMLAVSLSKTKKVISHFILQSVYSVISTAVISITIIMMWLKKGLKILFFNIYTYSNKVKTSESAKINK